MAARDLVFNNFWWKLLSVLLAVLTWITIDATLRKDSEQTPVITSSHREFTPVPVTLLTSPRNTNQFRISPALVSVDVSGNADDLKKLQVEQIEAFVDATAVQDEREVRKEIQVRTPPDVRVEKVDPAFADLERITPAK
jgi:YbbR domain-containing protein